MNKINGYTEEEATGLIEYIYEGKNAGKTLTYLFETYGREHNRAKGSVRNYYYAFLKKRDDLRVKAILEGKELSAGEIKPFTEEETEEMLKKVLLEKSKGLSVRRAIMNVAGGDEKLTLRIQNKYRNLSKKQPERIMQAAQKAGRSRGEELFTAQAGTGNRRALFPSRRRFEKGERAAERRIGKITQQSKGITKRFLHKL